MSLSQNPIPADKDLTREIVRVLRMGATFQAALHGLHSKLELPAVLDEQERMKLAAAYEGTAATLRGRAVKQPAGSEERAETERRAARYEARARIKRSGEPMPRDLRTPKERLEAIALVREAISQLLELMADVDGPDLEFFESALVDERKLLPPRAGPPGEQFVLGQSILRALAGRLGALFDETGGAALLPFAIPATEGEGIVTSVIAGAPGPQPRVFFTPGPSAPPAELQATEAAVSESAPNGTPAHGPETT
jgi:hypothetical protein